MLRAATGVLVIFCASCGYVGPVVPPSPQLPGAVTDLAALERGDEIVITFDPPSHTTDSLPIKTFSNIDLRIGPAIVPFDFDRWAATARQYELAPPDPDDPDNPKPRPMSKAVPASDWVGQRVAIAVRTSIKKTDHFSPWSNRVVLEVIPPLKQPEVNVQATKDGYKLTWQEEQPGRHYQVFRRGPHENAAVQIGTTDKPEYVDATSQWDTPYVYTVVAQQGPAESLASGPVSIVHADTFAPSTPAAITALAGPDTVEVSWARSPESDLKGYYLYRSISGAPLTRVGDLLTLPAYSDHNVEHGKTYRYAVAAVDQKNNESEKSGTAEVAF